MDEHHAAGVRRGDVMDRLKRAEPARSERDETDPDAVGEALRDAQASLEQAVVHGNLSKDPMRFPLGALAVDARCDAHDVQRARRAVEGDQSRDGAARG